MLLRPQGTYWSCSLSSAIKPSSDEAAAPATSPPKEVRGLWGTLEVWKPGGDARAVAFSDSQDVKLKTEPGYVISQPQASEEMWECRKRSTPLAGLLTSSLPLCGHLRTTSHPVSHGNGSVMS